MTNMEVIYQERNLKQDLTDKVKVLIEVREYNCLNIRQLYSFLLKGFKVIAHLLLIIVIL